MKNIRHFFTILVIGFIVSACSATKPVSFVKEVKPLPSWYLNPPHNSTEFLYGVSEGTNLEEAKENALEDMVSQLGVSISSRYESRLNVHKSYTEHFRKETSYEIKSEVAKIRISNYETIQSKKLGYQKFIVLIRSNKLQFVRALEKELQHKIEAMQIEYKSIKESNALSRYAFYNKGIKELNTMFSTVLVLDTLQNENNNKEYFGLVSQLNSESQALKESMTFSLQCDEASKPFKEEISVGLGNDHKRITKQNKGKDHTLIVLHTDTDYAKAHGFDIARTTLVIEVKDSKGKTIGGNRISLTGHATQGKGVALKDAAKKLKIMIYEQGISDIMGLDI